MAKTAPPDNGCIDAVVIAIGNGSMLRSVDEWPCVTSGVGVPMGVGAKTPSVPRARDRVPLAGTTKPRLGGSAGGSAGCFAQDDRAKSADRRAMTRLILAV